MGPRKGRVGHALHVSMSISNQSARLPQWCRCSWRRLALPAVAHAARVCRGCSASAGAEG